MGAGDVVQALAHSAARVHSELYHAHQPRFYRAECCEAGDACPPAAVGGADVQPTVRAHVRDGAEGFAAAVAGDGVSVGFLCEMQKFCKFEMNSFGKDKIDFLDFNDMLKWSC